jgi:hypothetical protein
MHHMVAKIQNHPSTLSAQALQLNGPSAVVPGVVAVGSFVASLVSGGYAKLRGFAIAVCLVSVFWCFYLYSAWRPNAKGVEHLGQQTKEKISAVNRIAQKHEQQRQAAAVSQRSAAGSEAVASGDPEEYMKLLRRMGEGLDNDLSADPGYRQTAQHMKEQLNGESVRGIARHDAQLHGGRDLVPTHRPSTLTDSSIVSNSVQTLTGVELGAQSEEIMRNFTGGNLTPGIKAEQPNNFKSISKSNGNVIRAEGESSRLTTPEGGDDDALGEYFMRSSLGQDSSEVESARLIDEARANAEQR